METIKIIAISDTHNRHDEITIPECDILLHTGDYSSQGYDWEITKFYKWFNKQPAKHKVSIQGNHELGWEKDPANGTRIAKSECPGVHLLYDQSVTLEGIKIWGSPVSPYFLDWAYNRARTPAESAMYNKPLIKEHYKTIPIDVNILLTHGPAYGILDKTVDGRNVGCVDLLEKVKVLKPDIHVSGHIHHSYGQEHIEGTSFYNASICDEQYRPINPITIIDYVKEPI